MNLQDIKTVEQANTSPLDGSYRVTSGQASLHGNTAGLSSTIAILIGKSAGTKHVGAWR